MTEVALITGGSGFLGSHLCNRLAGEGWNIHVSGRSPTRAADPGFQFHSCDLADFSAVRQLLDDVQPTIVFHLAGLSNARPDMNLVLPTFHSHVTSAINLMTLLPEYPVRRLILTGSLTEASGMAPSSPYGAAKTVVCEYAKMFHRLYATPVVVVRPFMAFGPNQHESKVIPYVIRTLLSGGSPELGSGKWRADWIYVSDVVDGMYLAATSPGVEGGQFDLGRGELISLKSMLTRVAENIGSSASLRFSAQADRPDTPERIADIEHSRKVLNWEPVVSIDDGIERTIKSHVAKG